MLEQYGAGARVQSAAAAYPQWSLARVVAQQKDRYRIVTDHGEQTAECTGKMRYDTAQLVDFPTVGDFVLVSEGDEHSAASIHQVLPRKSVFVRKAVGMSGQLQPIAANIDTLFVCMSCNNNFNLSRLERYLSVAWDSGATPVIVLSKADLCDDLPGVIAQAERVSLYSDVVALCALQEGEAQKLAPYLKPGTTAAFVGSSGVGKSTLINKLLGTDALETAAIGQGDKGRHTTTGRALLRTEWGGLLIDTPGMRELGADSAELGNTFADIEELAQQCKFDDCTHSGEPGCAVQAAVEQGTLEQRRLQNYQKLKREAGYDGLSTRQIEEKKWAHVGGVKKMRKIGNQYRKDKYGG